MATGQESSAAAATPPPAGLAAVFGPFLSSKSSERLPVSLLATRGVERVLVFTGAGWASGSNEFLLTLHDWYGKLRMSPVASKVEIIFLSQDRTEKEFAAAFATMPWLAVPYVSRNHVLSALGVDALPCLSVLDINGKVLHHSGRQIIERDPQVKQFPWDGEEFAPSKKAVALQTAESVLSAAKIVVMFVLVQLFSILSALLGRAGKFLGAKTKAALESGRDMLKRGLRHAAGQCFIGTKALLWFLLTFPFKALLSLVTFLWRVALGRKKRQAGDAADLPPAETQIV